MTNLRIVLVCLAIGSSTALGCAFEVSPEPDTTIENPIAADQSVQTVQATPEVAIHWHQRGKAFIKQGEAGNPAVFEQAKDALQTCIDIDPKLTDCLRLMIVANRPRPECPACGEPAATIRAANVSAASAFVSWRTGTGDRTADP
jgi:hypothetical protein